MTKHSAVNSLRDRIFSLAEQTPKKIALISCDAEGKVLEEITYSTLSKRIEEAAQYLSDLSLKKGDRVALAFRNSPELLILSWAAWSMGIVTVPLDIKRDTVELCRYKIKLSNAKLLIVQKGVPKIFGEINIQDVKIREFSEFPSKSSAIIYWESGLRQTALILFTSGTTANPKGAKLTLENLIVNAENIRRWLRITDED